MASSVVVTGLSAPQAANKPPSGVGKVGRIADAAIQVLEGTSEALKHAAQASKELGELKKSIEDRMNAIHDPVQDSRFSSIGTSDGLQYVLSCDCLLVERISNLVGNHVDRTLQTLTLLKDDIEFDEKTSNEIVNNYQDCKTKLHDCKTMLRNLELMMQKLTLEKIQKLKELEEKAKKNVIEPHWGNLWGILPWKEEYPCSCERCGKYIQLVP
jgi:Na+/phosphate symporter